MSKGGMLGIFAADYLNDDEKADIFIKQCAEQCHNREVFNRWDKALVNDIITYANSKVKNEITFVTENRIKDSTTLK